MVELPDFIRKSVQNDVGESVRTHSLKQVFEAITEELNMAGGYHDPGTFAKPSTNVTAPKLNPPEEVANWIVHMPYIHLKSLAIGLLGQCQTDKPPTTYQEFVEILHSWAVEVVDPPTKNTPSV